METAINALISEGPLGLALLAALAGNWVQYRARERRDDRTLEALTSIRTLLEIMAQEGKKQ